MLKIVCFTLSMVNKYYMRGKEMSIFLLGGHEINEGPSNVNKAIIKQAGKDLTFTRTHNKITRNLEIIWHLLTCDKVIISGMCAPRNYYLVRLLNRRYSYLMHGCLEFENKINNLHVSRSELLTEAGILKNAERIICVSEDYAEWIKNRYPAYRNKITFITNGIKLEKRQKVQKKPYSIAVSGGNRRIKNNGEVYKAVKLLNEHGINCHLYIFGTKYRDNDQLEGKYASYLGQLSKEDYYEKLDRINCFVLNSEVEPFGLVIADALNCNCSLVISKNVGAASIMKCSEKEVIQNPHDIQEIAVKIKTACECSNSERLFDSIDINSCSESAAYLKLMKIAESY